MKPSDNQNRASTVVLTLLWPFAGLISALTGWRQPWMKNIFWLVCAYIGAIFIFAPEGIEFGYGADGARYVLRLYEYSADGVTLRDVLSNFMIDQGNMDIYMPLVTLLIAKIGGGGHSLFFVYAVVFGFFYSRNIWYILERLPQQFGKYVYVIITVFILLCPIWLINGVRMYTAMQVFVYGMMPYVLERDRSKIIWVILAPLIHFSFVYVSVLALAYCFMPQHLLLRSKMLLWVSYILFAATLLIDLFNVEVLSSYLQAYSPEVYEERIDMYTSESSVEAAVNAGPVNWYVSLSGEIVRYGAALFILLTMPSIVSQKTPQISFYNIYLWTLLVGIYANIIAVVPSGGRFIVLFEIFGIALQILIITRVGLPNFLDKPIRILTLLYFVPIIFNIRCGFDYVGYPLFAGNFFTVPIVESNVPLINVIKNIL